MMSQGLYSTYPHSLIPFILTGKGRFCFKVSRFLFKLTTMILWYGALKQVKQVKSKKNKLKAYIAYSKYII